MKSKRKQINKYHHRLYDDLHEDELNQYIKRNTGSKPFQLTKLRFNRNKLHEANFNLHQRYITKREEMKDENQFYLDLMIKKKNINNVEENIQLHSQRKILVYEDADGIENQQMALTMYASQKKMIKRSYKESLKQSLRESLKEQNQSKSPQRAMKELLNRKKHKKHCESCQSHKQCNVKIGYKNDENALQPQQNMNQHQGCIHETNQQNEQQNIQTKESKQLQNVEDKYQTKFIANNVFPLHINANHIYTNIKWRSKSQIFQVDKWKLKYRLQKQIQQQPVVIKAKSTTKISQNIHEGQSMQQRLFKKKYLLTSNQNDNVRFPHINQQVIQKQKGRISDRSIKDLKIKTQKIDKALIQEANPEKQQFMNKLMKTKLQSINEQSQNRQNQIKSKKPVQLYKKDVKDQIRHMVHIMKKRSRQKQQHNRDRDKDRQANKDKEIKVNQNHIPPAAVELIKKIEQQKYKAQQLKKQSQQFKRKKKSQNDNEIVIKKMYSDQKQNNQENQQTNLRQTNTQIVEEIQRQQSKLTKKKWKFPSIQITTIYSSKQQQDTKRKQKQSKIQKYSKQWRLKAPQKVVSEKISQQGVQRWQYIGSRQDSREQVDMYLKIRQQQQFHQKQLRQQRQLKELKQKEQMYKNYLQNGEMKVEKLQIQLIQANSK